MNVFACSFNAIYYEWAQFPLPMLCIGGYAYGAQAHKSLHFRRPHDMREFLQDLFEMKEACHGK